MTVAMAFPSLSLSESHEKYVVKQVTFLLHQALMITPEHVAGFCGEKSHLQIDQSRSERTATTWSPTKSSGHQQQQL